MRIKKLKPGFEKLTKAKARLVAHLIGDGAHYRSKHDYNMKLEVKDDESLQQFNDDLIAVYGLKPTWEWNTSGITGKPIQLVRLRAKLAFEDLHKYATYFSKDWKIKKPILEASLPIKREFLRALFDDEGSIRSRYNILLYSINDKGLKQVKKMLKEFDISCILTSGYGSKKNVFALLIEDLPKFYTKIGFNLKRKQEKLRQFVE